MSYYLPGYLFPKSEIFEIQYMTSKSIIIEAKLLLIPEKRDMLYRPGVNLCTTIEMRRYNTDKGNFG